MRLVGTCSCAVEGKFIIIIFNRVFQYNNLLHMFTIFNCLLYIWTESRLLCKFSIEYCLKLVTLYTLNSLNMFIILTNNILPQ